MHMEEIIIAESEELVSVMTASQAAAQQSQVGMGWPLLQKVPDVLRSIEKGGRYFDPEVVAIGPYHRGNPKLLPAEAVKKAVALDFCKSTRQYSVRDFYAKVRGVAPQARACYKGPLGGISDKEFAAMMFFDGCFLLQFIAMLTGEFLPAPSPYRWMSPLDFDRARWDILLLENQLPWVVLEALMSLRCVSIDQYLQKFVAQMDMYTGSLPQFGEGEGGGGGGASRRGRSPCHLLELVREKFLEPKVQKRRDMVTRISTFTSASELAEVGVRIRASDTLRFSNISFRRGPVYGWLSLPPIVLTPYTLIVLSNIVALEILLSGAESDSWVGSYLSLLVALISGKEDVRELRSKRIIYGDLSDQQALDFLKSLSPFLFVGNDYMSLLQHLNDYYRNRRVRVCIHKILYKNFKFLLAATSVIVFFVTILQTIFTVYPRKN